MRSLLRPFAVLACALLLAAPTISRADDAPALDSDTFEGLRARSLGPGVMGGRVSCLDGVPGDRVTLWIGTAGGGVWVSKDGATTFKPVFDKYCQSIGASPFDSRKRLALEKCLQPKKPLCAESGEGCGALRTRCLWGSTKAAFFWA